MKIFIIGATGVLGKRVASQLVKQGYEVQTLVRSKEKALEIEKIGGTGFIGSVYDKVNLLKMTKGVDGLLHLATSIPRKSKTKSSDWDENNRLRTELTKILIEVVKENKISFYIQNSVLFIYGQRNGAVISEETVVQKPIITAVKLSKSFRYDLESQIDGESMINFELKTGFPGIIMRFGFFYSTDSTTTRDIVNTIKKGKFPIIGKGKAFINFIHVDDAAEAVISVIKNYNKVIGKTFNISDNEPVSLENFLIKVSLKLGAKKPGHVPVFLAKMFAGEYSVNLFLSSYKNKNSMLKKMTNWEPKYHNFEKGFNQVLEEINNEQP